MVRTLLRRSFNTWTELKNKIKPGNKDKKII